MTKRPRKALDLPERFEDLAAKVAPPPPPKEDVRPMGGMEKTKWAGVDMWRCPKCHATVWNEADARVHTCKRPKFADEAEE
jgi:hypothetical protein